MMSAVSKIHKEKLITEHTSGKGYALFIAVLPIFMMYKVPAIGIGVSTTMIIVSFFYAASVIFNDILLNNGRFRIAKIVIPFVIYLLYVVIKSIGDTVNMIQTMLIIVHIVAFSMGAVNTECLKKYIIAISAAAAILTMIQTILHYVFGVHLPCIAPDLCLDSLQYYRGIILTGYQETSSLYRPSAFFLEPSHLTQYSFVGLLLCLFHGKRQIPAAVCISLGMVSTTSGMGIMLAGGIWFLYVLDIIRKSEFSSKIAKSACCLLGMITALCILYQFEFFRSALQRVFSPVKYSQNNYNAIWGRTLYWDKYISPMGGRELIFGFGYINLPDIYFTGLMELIYCSGIIGVALYYFAMIKTAVLYKGISRIIAGLLCGLMLIANSTSLIWMTYYIGSLIVFGLEEYFNEIKDEKEIYIFKTEY